MAITAGVWFTVNFRKIILTYNAALSILTACRSFWTPRRNPADKRTAIRKFLRIAKLRAKLYTTNWSLGRRKQKMKNTTKVLLDFSDKTPGIIWNDMELVKKLSATFFRLSFYQPLWNSKQTATLPSNPISGKKLRKILFSDLFSGEDAGYSCACNHHCIGCGLHC